MPNPISSNPSAQSAGSNYDLDSDDVGPMSRADVLNSSQAEPAPISCHAEPSATSPSGVPNLVSSVPPPPSALPPTAAPSGPGANNNAQRTDERLGIAPYLSAGHTAAGDAVHAGVALLKGRDPSGAAVEVLSASIQIGAQSELQAGFQRVAGTAGGLSGSVETFSLRANVGTHNDDGSVGLNVGATATALGFEGTLGGDSSLTYGVGAGVGAAASVGARDVDRDGKTEVCARLSLGPVTVGACLENPL